MNTHRHTSLIFTIATTLLFSYLAACTSTNSPPPTAMPEWTHTTLLANDQDHPISAAADDEFVYFTAGGTMAAQQDGTNSLRKVPIKGGAVTVLASGGKGWIPSAGIALDDDFVYFSTGNTILRVPKAGGAPVPIASGLRGVNEMVLSGDRVYLLSFVERSVPTPIQAVDKRGGKVDTLVDQQMGANNICVDADFIYWATPSGIMRAKKDGSDVTTLYAPPSGFTTRLALDADTLYFTEGDGRNVLMKLPKAGGTPVKLAPAINTTYEIGIDSEFVYYFDDEGKDIALRKVAKAGGTPITLDSGSGGWIGSLVVRQHALFFQGISQIYSLTK